MNKFLAVAMPFFVAVLAVPSRAVPACEDVSVHGSVTLPPLHVCLPDLGDNPDCERREVELIPAGVVVTVWLCAPHLVDLPPIAGYANTAR